MGKVLTEFNRRLYFINFLNLALNVDFFLSAAFCERREKYYFVQHRSVEKLVWIA